jgi:hypothetical protein
MVVAIEISWELSKAQRKTLYSALKIETLPRKRITPPLSGLEERFCECVVQKGLATERIIPVPNNLEIRKLASELQFSGDPGLPIYGESSA